MREFQSYTEQQTPQNTQKSSENPQSNCVLMDFFFPCLIHSLEMCLLCEPRQKFRLIFSSLAN